MVEAWHLQKVHHASRGAGSRVRATENHASNSRVDERACAHRAWFLRHVEIAFGQSPVANGCLSLCQSEHFCVRSSILEQLNLIMSAADNFSCKDNNRADRNFAGAAGFLRQSQCFAHEILVVCRIHHRINVVATALRAVQLNLDESLLTGHRSAHRTDSSCGEPVATGMRVLAEKISSAY